MLKRQQEPDAPVPAEVDRFRQIILTNHRVHQPEGATPGHSPALPNSPPAR